MMRPRLSAAVVCAIALIAGPATVTSAPTATAAAPKVSAGHLLATLPVRHEAHGSSYVGDEFKHWIDADQDGQDTRAEVLRAESTRPTTSDASGAIRTGRWVSRYDGEVVRTASKLDVDQLVPLREAWTSGAWAWSKAKRTAYANDLGYGADLIAVSEQSVRVKGDGDPTEYLPSKSAYRCEYVRSWVAVKYRWHLSVDAAEKAAIQDVLHASCTSLRVTKPAKPVLSRLVGSTGGSGASGGSGSGSGGGTTSALDPRYGTCTELLTHPNHAPYRRGADPEYGWYEDRDGDGLVCE